MRTYTINLTPTKAVEIQVPNLLSFMYSPQVVSLKGLDQGDKVTVVVTNTFSEESMQETKVFYKESLKFEMAKMIQILSELDPVKALQRIDYSNTATKGLLQKYGLQVRIEGYESDLGVDVFLLPGALDGAEAYGIGKKTQRLFVNFPQSLNCWTDSQLPLSFNSFNLSFNSSYNGIENTDIQAADDICKNSKCSEVNVLKFLEDHRPAAANSLKAGRTITGYYGISANRIQYGEDTPAQDPREELTLKPDLRTQGVYLRWLGRNGETEYWLFTPGKKNTSVAVRNAFSRFMGDTSIPEGGVLPNEEYQDYTETRTITMGSNDVTMEEYERLCGLATSPVVEMLVDNIPDNYIWQRVNVAAGSYQRNIKRSTPGLQTFELTITLPKRNTIQL